MAQNKIQLPLSADITDKMQPQNLQTCNSVYITQFHAK